MQLFFSADEWLRLSPEERIRQCRSMAEEALTLAATDASRMRQHYFELAKTWIQLADEVQAHAISTGMQP